MPAGRRPEPAEVQYAKGNQPAGSPARSFMPRLESVPQMPSWFTGEAATCWQRVSEILFARGQLSVDSEISLVALCVCYEEWVLLLSDIRTQGRTQWTVGDRSGAEMERPRPSLAAFQDCDRRLKAWLVEFGLTDASRAKVAGAIPPDDGGNDPLSAYGLN